MELQLNIKFEQVMDMISQMPAKEWEKLKKKVDKKVNKPAVKPGKNKKEERFFGCMKGVITYMADDFNAPLDDFKDYM